MKILISGGSKNGKSFFAQEIALKMKKENKPLYYLATMVPKDEEDIHRINKHKMERKGWGFNTVEINKNILFEIEKCDKDGSFLLDSTTALLANEMFLENGKINFKAREKITYDLIKILDKVNNIVIVSDNIYSDSCIYDEFTNRYRESLALIDRDISKFCNVVIEACYGNFIFYKGEELFNGFI